MTVIQFPGSSISFSQIAQAFSDAMKKRGMIPPLKIIDDGKIHRCDVDGKRGKGDGAYLLFATGKIPAGGFQNHKDGLGWENWSYDLGRQTLTAVEQRELQLKRATTARERAEKDAQDIVAAQQKAERIGPAPGRRPNTHTSTGNGWRPTVRASFIRHLLFPPAPSTGICAACNSFPLTARSYG